VFEPLDAETLETIEDELQAVFDFDPRVEVLQLDIRRGFDGEGRPNGNAVTAAARLLFIELNIVDNFDLNIVFEE
jgi:phage baseplate assembly protein W